MPSREDILDAAARVYAAEGSRAFSMRRVAGEVGVSATALYRHFEGKEALTIAIALRAARSFESYLLQSLKEPTPQERMWQMGLCYRRFALEQPAYYRVLFMSPHPEFESLRDETLAEFPSTFQLLVDRVRENQDVGAVIEGDPEALALTVWAHVHGLVSLHLDGHFDQQAGQFDALFRASLGWVLDGLAP